MLLLDVLLREGDLANLAIPYVVAALLVDFPALVLNQKLDLCGVREQCLMLISRCVYQDLSGTVLHLWFAPATTSLLVVFPFALTGSLIGGLLLKAHDELCLPKEVVRAVEYWSQICGHAVLLLRAQELLIAHILAQGGSCLCGRLLLLLFGGRVQHGRKAQIKGVLLILLLLHFSIENAAAL
jgi:hypothetical protein